MTGMVKNNLSFFRPKTFSNKPKLVAISLLSSYSNEIQHRNILLCLLLKQKICLHYKMTSFLFLEWQHCASIMSQILVHSVHVSEPVRVFAPPNPPYHAAVSSVAVSQWSRVGGVTVRWLRERQECLRNHQMGCLSVANRMHSCPEEGVVSLLASPGQCGAVRRLSPRCVRVRQPFIALTLWNSPTARC